MEETTLVRIRINSTEENKDRGFFTLLTSGASVICLDNQEYIVPNEAIAQLKKNRVNYEPVE